MARDKALSHERLIRVAKEEFLAKGFINASMREIGRKSSLSQSAIYRHYLNKEDMFSKLVEPGIEAMSRLALEHEKEAYLNFDNNINPDEMLKNNNTRMVKEIILNYRDEFKLILCCSQGTRYEGFINSLVEAEFEGTKAALKYIKARGVKVKEVSDSEIHMLLSAYMTACFEPIVHDWSIEEAMHGLDLIEEFFIPGWRKIFGI